MEPVCPICFENTCNTTTLCNHSFCITCLLRWKECSTTCPVCRESLIGEPLDAFCSFFQIYGVKIDKAFCARTKLCLRVAKTMRARCTLSIVYDILKIKCGNITILKLRCNEISNMNTEDSVTTIKFRPTGKSKFLYVSWAENDAVQEKIKAWFVAASDQL